MEAITKKYPVRIKIIGIGGAGGNAVNRMVSTGLIETSEVEIISINTDLQALRNSKAPIVIQIGPKTTKGQGSGGNPAVGREAAEESIETIRDLISNSDMLFLTCGMGKGTGTGATPVVARLAREMDILTVAVVTKPFKFEGPKIMENAENGIAELKKYVDAVLVIPNDKFIELYPNLSFTDVLYRLADDVLFKAVFSMWNVITRTGFVNVDFADARNVLKGAGEIIMSYGVEKSDTENALKKAIKSAINSPFLNVNIRGAKKFLVNFCGKNILSGDVSTAGEYLRQFLDNKDALVYMGYVNSDEFEDKVEVTIIASGFQVIPDKVKTRRYIKETSESTTTLNTETKLHRIGRLRVLK